MKERKLLLLSVLMAIVMMAMSPTKVWAESLTEGDNTIQIGAVEGDPESASGYQLYEYVPAKSGILWVQSSGPGDTYGAFWNSDLSEILISDDDGAGSQQFRFHYSVTAGTKYYIGVRSYEGEALEGDFVINLYLDAPCAVDDHKMTMYQAKNATCTEQGYSTYYECSECGHLYSDSRGQSQLNDIPYNAPALGHNLDENNLCSRCGETILPTVVNIDDYSSPINIYSSYLTSGSERVDFGSKIIITGTSSGKNNYICINTNPITGKLILKDLNLNIGSPALISGVTNGAAQIEIQGDVVLTSSVGVLGSKSFDITGTGNLTMNGTSAPTVTADGPININIEGELNMENTGCGMLFGSSLTIVNAYAKNIYMHSPGGGSPFFINAANASLSADGDIIMETTNSSFYQASGYDKIGFFKSLQPGEGHVAILRCAIGSPYENVGIVCDDPDYVPSVSDGNTNLTAFTWKLEFENGSRMYYGCNPQTLPGIISMPGAKPYLSLNTDSEGTIFDITSSSSYSNRIDLYSDYFTCGSLKSYHTGHPIFTGAPQSNSVFLHWIENSAEGKEPILRNLTIDSSAPSIERSNNAVDITAAFAVEGDVVLKSDVPVIYAPTNITGTGNLSLIEKGDNAVTYYDLNVNILGDLFVQRLKGSQISYDSNINFDITAKTITMKAANSSAPFLSNIDKVKMHAKGDILMENQNSFFADQNNCDKMWLFGSNNLISDNGKITFLMGKGTAHEYVSILPIPSETPAVSEGNTAVTEYAAFVERDGTKTWFANENDAKALQPNYVASVTIGETTANYTSISKAINDVMEADKATLTLLAGIHLGGNRVTFDKGNVTFDLNGKTLGATSNVVEVDGCSLIITDNSEDKTGRVDAVSGAVYVNSGSITIHAGTFYASQGSSLGICEGVTATIDGGRFYTSHEHSNAIYTNGVSALASGYAYYITGTDTKVVIDEDGNIPAKDITVKKSGEDPEIEEAVSVKIGETTTTYADFKTALEVAKEADEATMTLLKDVAITYTVFDKGNLTLDLNGYTIANTNGSAMYVEGASLTIVDGSDDQTGKVASSGGMYSSTLTVSSGSLTIYAGTFESGQMPAFSVYKAYGSEILPDVKVYGGRFISPYAAICTEADLLPSGYDFYDTDSETKLTEKDEEGYVIGVDGYYAKDVTVKGTTTGVSAAEVNGSAQNDVIYNVNGQRISSPERGKIYIQNGKKMVK